MSKIIDDLVKQIDEAIKINKDYLWQDNLEESVACIPLQNYIKGENTKEDNEKEINIIDIIPLWNKLHSILSLGTHSLIEYESDILKLIDEQIEEKVSRGDLQGIVSVIVHKIFIAGKKSAILRRSNE